MTLHRPAPIWEGDEVKRAYRTSTFIAEQYKRGNLSEHQLKAAALFLANVELAYTMDADAGVIDPERIRVDHSVRNVDPQWQRDRRNLARKWLKETEDSMPTPDHWSCLIDVCYLGNAAWVWASNSVAVRQGKSTKKRKGMDHLRVGLNQIYLEKDY